MGKEPDRGNGRTSEGAPQKPELSLLGLGAWQFGRKERRWIDSVKRELCQSSVTLVTQFPDTSQLTGHLTVPWELLGPHVSSASSGL